MRTSRRKSKRQNSKAASHKPQVPASSLTTLVPSVKSVQNRSRMVLTQWEPTPVVLLSSITGTRTYNRSFSVSSLADTAIFTSYDAYRISGVDIVYKPNSYRGDAPESALASGSNVWAAFDPDDNTTVALTGPGSIPSMQTCSIHSMYENWEICISPVPSVALYSAGAFAGYEIPGNAKWIDTDNLTVPHYGFKIVMPQAYIVASGTLYFRYHLELAYSQ